jgi:hypothetical protein
MRLLQWKWQLSPAAGDTEEDLVASMVTATGPLSALWWWSLSTSPIRVEKAPYLQVIRPDSGRLSPG